MVYLNEILLTDLEALARRATALPWEPGGPYPSVSVIVCIDGGIASGPDAEPPAYDPVAWIYQAQPETYSDPPPEQAVADRNYIVAACNNVPRLVAEVVAKVVPKI